MITIRLKTAILVLVVALSSHVALAGRKSVGTCPKGAPCSKVQSKAIKSAAPHKQPAPVVQPVSQEQADIEKAQAESLQIRDAQEARVMQESLKTLEQDEEARINKVIVEHGVAESLTSAVDTETHVMDKQKPVVATTVKERVKNWFTDTWSKTKNMCGDARDYVKKNTLKIWEKTKDGSQLGWTKSKVAFKNLLAKITPAKKVTA